jgi:ComF family protein
MGILNIVGGFARSSLSYTSDLLLPPVCIACSSLTDGHNLLCARCWRNLHIITPPLCERTGVPLPGSSGPGPFFSTEAILNPPDFDRARAVARYGGLMSRLIVAFKFEDRHEALPLFTNLLLQAGRELIDDADIIAPVPLHPLRLLQRRFNQSALLARALAKRSGKPAALHVLRRVRRTPPQVGLAQGARKSNVAGAFAVARRSAGAIAGKRVLLIDDVITTGATANACARALKAAGAAEADVLALALVSGAWQAEDGE